MKLWETNCKDETKSGNKNVSETTVLLRSRTEWGKESLKKDKLQEFKEMSTRHSRDHAEEEMKERTKKCERGKCQKGKVTEV